MRNRIVVAATETANGGVSISFIGATDDFVLPFDFALTPPCTSLLAYVPSFSLFLPPHVFFPPLILGNGRSDENLYTQRSIALARLLEFTGRRAALSMRRPVCSCVHSRPSLTKKKKLSDSVCASLCVCIYTMRDQTRPTHPSPGKVDFAKGLSGPPWASPYRDGSSSIYTNTCTCVFVCACLRVICEEFSGCA